MPLDACEAAANSAVSSQLDCGLKRFQKRGKEKAGSAIALGEVNTNRALPRCPVAPPPRPVAAASTIVRRNAPHEPITGLKQVDSDSDDGGEADTGLVPRMALPRFPRVNASGPPSRAETPSGSFCRTPSFRPSGSVSRQASDAAFSRQPSANVSRQPSAAGSGVHAVRQAGWSAASTPTHSMSVSQRPSRNGSFAGTLASDNQRSNSTINDAQTATQEASGLAVSRRGSARTAASSTPDCRSDVKRRLQEEALQQVEDDIARRQALFAPENVLVRRWLSLAALCASAKLLIEGGGKRVRAFNSRLYALHVLETRFVPMWRLHSAIRKRKARQVIARFILRCAVRRRLQRRNQSIDIVKNFFRNKSGMFQAYARWFKGRVVVIQRAFRRFKCRRDAMVELNFRFCRKFEEGYWNAAANAALEVLQNRFLIQINAAKSAAEGRGRAGGRRRLTHANADSAAAHVDMVPPALPATYPTRKSLGPIPESIVKKCIRPLLTRKSREYQREIHRRITVACESMKRSRRGSIEAIRKVPDMCRRSVVVKLPPFRPFLTSMELYEVLDHAALMLSVLRDQPILALHLADGRSTVPAQDDLGLITQLSGDALQSDRLSESGDSRRCSLSDLLVFGTKTCGK